MLQYSKNVVIFMSFVRTLHWVLCVATYLKIKVLLDPLVMKVLGAAWLFVDVSCHSVD